MSTYISEVLRKQVYERAKDRCEYCLIPEIAVFVSHEIDHVIAIKHGGITELQNLALLCTLCNRYKGSDLASIDPETDQIVRLYNPRSDIWAKHFRLEAGRIVPLSPQGRVTVRLLNVNRPETILERNWLIDAGFIELPE